MRYFTINLIFAIGLSFHSLAQSPSLLISEADSLFDERKYTESYERYIKVFSDDEQYSLQMLLRMAFITEGLGEYEKALFFLNKYYFETFDGKASDKMQELSETHDLEGYERNDLSFFLNFLAQYQQQITLGLFLLHIIFLAIVALKRFKFSTQPVYSGISAVVVAVLLFVMLNLVDNRNLGIISENNTFLMEGPSPGADLVTIIDKGHRVQILDQSDLWTQIRFNENTAYVLSSHLMIF